jgi:aspartyl-tRNA(Asn)/glutamyl-tRNA(Gln) amidotransferase subunit B
VLPVINRVAVESSIKIGLALGCKIAERCHFARKNYFYPDTPKNFQTSQYDEPIAYDGAIDIELADGTVFTVEIERAHMEEDAGKLTHMGGSTGPHPRAPSSPSSTTTGQAFPLVGDRHQAHPRSRLARTGARPRPTSRDPGDRQEPRVSDARHGARQRALRRERLPDAQGQHHPRHPHRDQERELPALGRARGHLRDPAARRGPRLRCRHRAGDPPLARGHPLHTAGRPKSDADDYRYFPEPDLVPVVTNDAWIEKLRSELPEPPAERRKRLQADWGYSDASSATSSTPGVMSSIEDTVAAGVKPAVARKWWMGEISRRAKVADVEPAELGVTPELIVELNALIESGKINDKLSREVLDGVLAGEGTPAEVVEKRGLAVVSDDGPLLEAIDGALAAQPDVATRSAAARSRPSAPIVAAS